MRRCHNMRLMIKFICLVSYFFCTLNMVDGGLCPTVWNQGFVQLPDKLLIFTTVPCRFSSWLSQKLRLERSMGSNCRKLPLKFDWHQSSNHRQEYLTHQIIAPSGLNELRFTTNDDFWLRPKLQLELPFLMKLSFYILLSFQGSNSVDKDLVMPTELVFTMDTRAMEDIVKATETYNKNVSAILWMFSLWSLPKNKHRCACCNRFCYFIRGGGGGGCMSSSDMAFCFEVTLLCAPKVKSDLSSISQIGVTWR